MLATQQCANCHIFTWLFSSTSTKSTNDTVLFCGTLTSSLIGCQSLAVCQTPPTQAASLRRGLDPKHYEYSYRPNDTVPPKLDPKSLNSLLYPDQRYKSILQYINLSQNAFLT